MNPKSIISLPRANILGEDPIEKISRKDGTFHTLQLNLRHYLDVLFEHHNLQTDLLRAWATDALLLLGDELTQPQHD